MTRPETQVQQDLEHRILKCYDLYNIQNVRVMVCPVRGSVFLRKTVVLSMEKLLLPSSGEHNTTQPQTIFTEDISTYHSRNSTIKLMMHKFHLFASIHQYLLTSI